MKKYMCILLTILSILVTCINNVSVCAYDSKTVNTDIPPLNEELYYSYLNSLNSLDIPVDKPYAISDKVSYSDFALMLGGVLNNSAAVNLYMDKNLINSHKFINYDDVAKVLVSLLGWNVGNQPNRYLTISEKTGLNDNVENFDDSFCKYDIVMMLYNCLTSKTFEQTAYGSETEYAESDTTLAELYKQAYSFEGILVANPYSSVNELASVSSHTIVVSDEKNGNIFLKTDIDTFSLLGCKVKGFYSQNKTGGSKKLLTICYDYGCKSLLINNENKPYYDKEKGQISYMKNGKYKNIPIDYKAEIIYNGQYVVGNVEKILQRIGDTRDYALSYMKLISSDGSSKYDTIIIECYKTMVVESKSKTEFKLFGDKKELFNFDEEYRNGRISIVDGNGNPFEYNNIKKGDTVSIFEGDSNVRAIKIIVNSKMISGKLISIEQDLVNTYEFILKNSEQETEQIQKLEFAYSSLENNIYPDTYYDLYFDHTGRISRAVLNTESGVHYGLFVKILPKSETFETNKFDAMIMTNLNGSTSPEAQIISIRNNAVFNKVKITRDNYEQLNLDAFHTVVMYYTTSDGQISEIIGSDSGYEGALISKNYQKSVNADTAPKIDELEFVKVVNTGMFSAPNSKVSSGLPYMNISFSTFDSQQTRIKPIGNCKVIGVPDISVSKASMSYADDFYKVLDIENKEYFHLVGLAAYKVTAFYDEESVSPKFVIYSMDENNTIKDKSQITITDKIFIVSNVSSSKNPVSELECLKIEGMYGGLKTTLYTKQIGVLDYANAGSYINLTEGDLFIPNFDANGMITYGFMYYDYNPDTETGDFPEYINNGEYGITVGYPGFKGSINAYFVQKGYVYNIGYLDSGIIIADSMNSMENRVKSEIYGYAKPIKHIYVYDTQQKDKTKRITTGKLSTGITYFADKTNVSTAVIRQKSANCLDVVIYK